MKKFSFIIPIYKKTPDQLRKCLKSLYGQSYKEIEVICVFDGPDAELEKVVSEFKVNHSIIIEHGGAPKARNAGAKLATGDFISFWDADCYAEPEMVHMWEWTLRDNLDCDFCYSGYAWTDPKAPGFDSEPFDPFLLEHYNYIASMFPLARDKFPGWNEDLKGLQDWDYWRRVVKAGSKGAFIEGYGFITDLPKEGDISGAALDKTAERIAAVRKAQGDKDRDILVSGGNYKRETVNVTKLLDADFVNNTFYLVRPYKLSLMIGFHPQALMGMGEILNTTSRDCTRVVYWMGLDAEQFYTAPYWQVRSILKDMKEQIKFHFCNDNRTLGILEDMDIKAELLPLPVSREMFGLELPKDFKVLVLSDPTYQPVIDSVIKSMPDIEFVKVQPDVAYNMMDFSVSLQYLRNPRLDNNSRNFLIKGRYLISNVEAPHSGFLPVGEDATKFKNEIINRIRELKEKKKPNQEARDYYLNLASPEKFKERILSLVSEKVAVVA